MPEARDIATRCCVVGGGPAGVMVGFLLARGGVDVVVLEKHADFLRDFRGDTIHPSTLEMMAELGLLEDLLARPHQRVEKLVGVIGDERVTVADFRRLSTRCRFIAFMPQWDFLDFLTHEAKRLPGFKLLMKAEAKNLRMRAGAVVGVDAVCADGPFAVSADLVIAADGRHSTLRAAAGLTVENVGAPMDVYWLRLSKQPGEPPATLGRIGAGTMFVMLDRGDYWQCALAIPKGSADELRARGLAAFRDLLARASAMPRERFDEIDSFDKAKLLTVTVDRLQQWAKPGLLCIGDAAHAMSPVGGVGINLALQDAVAAANLLAEPLARGPVDLSILRKVQARRQFAVKATQRMQVFIQDRIIAPALQATRPLKVPWPALALNRFPWLQGLPARLIGIGLRPEHIAPPLRSPAPNECAPPDG